MSSRWNKNLIIFAVALGSTCFDGWIKIRVFGAHQELTLDQTWSSLVKVAKNLREAQVWCKTIVEGKILMFLSRILGSQAETRLWALEIKPKGYQCGVSPPKQEIEAAP